MDSILIKFMSPDPVVNVVTAVAARPKLFVPLIYRNEMADGMRMRLNYFFHRRSIDTVLTDPVLLERDSLTESEHAIEKLLKKYTLSDMIVDLTDADPQTAFAFGRVCHTLNYLKLPIITVNFSKGMFEPMMNGGAIRRLTFPSLTAEEFRFLRDGVNFEKETARPFVELYRRDLDRTTVALIRALSRIYYDRPTFWSGFSEKLLKTTVGNQPGKKEYLIESGTLPIRDEVFQELVERGILTRFQRRSGVFQLVFPNRRASEFLLRLGQIPLMNVFLTVALVKKNDKNAAYHDLTMIDYRYVTGINGVIPVVIGLLKEREDALNVYEFDLDASKLYSGNVRKILVRPSELRVDDGVRAAAAHLDIEIVPFQKLAAMLEPK